MLNEQTQAVVAFTYGGRIVFKAFKEAEDARKYFVFLAEAYRQEAASYIDAQGSNCFWRASPRS